MSQVSTAHFMRSEEVFVGAGTTVTVDGGGLIGRDLPAGFETAEVIETHDVAGFDSPLHALDPPVVSPRLQGFPVVKRIAPALTGLAESVGRHACDKFRREVLV